ncbi:MAG: amidohydrolase family protein [Acidobacteriota bacterium]
MTTLYSALWVLPISSPPIEAGALAIEGTTISEVGTRSSLTAKFPDAEMRHFGEAAILPGLINAHSHLELTAMRGFLDNEEGDFLAWLRKLTLARLERMTEDDLYVSAAWGVCEALRAGVTCVADASDAASQSMRALRDTGLRGTVFQESFGPDPKLARQNFASLQEKVARLRGLESALVRVGVSPHAPYSVCARQLELISEYALGEKLPVMMHAGESVAEEMLLREGEGKFADGLRKRNIEWIAPGLSTIQYLARHGVLQTQPLLAHCINVDEADIETIKLNDARVAHCPKSNAKLGHGRAPFQAFLERGITAGLGSDSVASNNSCDILEEARFAVLMARSGFDATPERKMIEASDALRSATLGGARAVGLEGRVGELKTGLEADFAVVSLSGIHQLPSYDPVNTLVFSASGRDVIATFVAGDELYYEGAVKGLDEERLGARMKEIVGKLRA